MDHECPPEQLSTTDLRVAAELMGHPAFAKSYAGWCAYEPGELIFTASLEPFGWLLCAGYLPALCVAHVAWSWLPWLGRCRSLFRNSRQAVERLHIAAMQHGVGDSVVQPGGGTFYRGLGQAHPSSVVLGNERYFNAGLSEGPDVGGHNEPFVRRDLIDTGLVAEDPWPHTTRVKQSASRRWPCLLYCPHVGGSDHPARVIPAVRQDRIDLVGGYTDCVVTVAMSAPFKRCAIG